MNKMTQKVLAPLKKIWRKHKIPVVLGAIFIVASMTAMCATCGD